MTETAPTGFLDEGELAVVAHAAAGLTWSETADALGSSERTVRRRLTSAAEKLGTRGVTHTVAVAVARGLVDPFHPLGAAPAEPPADPRRPAGSPPAGAPDPRGLDRRRSQVLARFTGRVEEALLEMLRRGSSLSDAAEQIGLTPQAVFGRARWDREWASRLDSALMDGRDPYLSHGTDHTYKQYGCRCPDCRAAHSRFR